MESRKMMQNVSGGIDSAGQFKHARGRHAHGLMFLQHLIIWHGWKWGLRRGGGEWPEKKYLGRL